MIVQVIRVCAVASVAWCAACATSPAAVVGAKIPLDAQRFMIPTTDGPQRGIHAWVYLQHGFVDVVVTERASSACESVRVDTRAWHASEDVAIAINANFFGGPASCTDIIGLAKSDGRVVSPARSHDGRFDPCIVFRADGTASIGYLDGVGAGVTDAVAGVGGSASSGVEGTLLVTAGQNTGATARVQPHERHPRTAVGLSEDGRELFVAVVDGRQPAWSIGMTLPELADFMLSLGVYNAVALDGGGSSSFVFEDPITGERLENRPSDHADTGTGVFRPVANHLGIRYVSE